MSAKCWMMKALFDRRGFSKSAHLFKCVLYNFWAQVSSVPLGIYIQGEKKKKTRWILLWDASDASTKRPCFGFPNKFYIQFRNSFLPHFSLRGPKPMTNEKLWLRPSATQPAYTRGHQINIRYAFKATKASQMKDEYHDYHVFF